MKLLLLNAGETIIFINIHNPNYKEFSLLKKNDFKLIYNN